ncbi:MAG: ATP-dependent Clp protease proteolytic subunit [Parcubacteria group bacterium]|nr:ATP-dependent Clp protease proteolytic subunit [Parcubacteria group bacterium]
MGIFQRIKELLELQADKWAAAQVTNSEEDSEHESEVIELNAIEIKEEPINKVGQLCIISLGSEIDEEIYDFFMQQFYSALFDSDIGRISVIINSPGGSVNAGIAIYETIRLSPKPVTTTVQGRASSVAAVIAQAGHTRKITKYSSMLLHQPRVIPQSDTEYVRYELELLGNEVHRIENNILSIFAEKTKKTPSQIRKDTGVYQKIFTAKEALEYGLVDEII